MAVGIQQIKQQLQESVFLPNDERLIAMVHVYKVPRKRKGSYLCTVCKFLPTVSLLPLCCLITLPHYASVMLPHYATFTLPLYAISMLPLYIGL